jgi:hypothetical protein
MLAGWGGLIAVVRFSTPSGGARWVFFFTLVLAFTGTVLPLVAFVNHRKPRVPPPTPLVVLRQSLWVGIYVATLAWLQIGRVLTPVIWVMLGLGLVLIEWLLRLRERSEWKP